MTTEQIVAAQVGDVVQVAGHRVGDGPQTGEIVEVLGAGDHPHFRIRWENGRETILYPGSDIVVLGARRAAPPA